jgi:phosphoserine phosphatase
MKVVAYDPFVEESDTLLLSLNELFHVSDILTLHIPLTTATRNLINRETIQEMKDAVILINTSRGEVINEEDLYDALIRGKISYAGLDVFHHEPTPSEQLVALDNVVLTSHIGSNTVGAQDRIGDAVIEEVKAFLHQTSTAGRNLYVLTVSSEDRPGITAALTTILLNHHIPILDVEQATIQGLLALSFLVQIDSRLKAKVSDDLLEKAKALQLHLKLTPFTQTKHRREKTLYAVTCLTHVPRGDVLATVSTILSQHTANIETIRQVHGNDVVALELLIDVHATPDLTRLKQDLMSTGETLRFDIALQKENIFRTSKRLIVFDMDSTLVDMELIDEIAQVAGVQNKLSAITEAVNTGKLDFADALRQRVAMLKGVSIDALRYVANNLRLTKGARALIITLKRMGFKIALISGGFTFFTDHLHAELDLDYAYGNKLVIADKRLTGAVEDPIIDGPAKADIMQHIAETEAIPLDQVVAVGNGANDIEMLSRAGLGIAYHPSGDYTKYVEGTITRTTLTSILYLLGLTEETPTA